MDYTADSIGQLTGASGKESGGVTNRLHEHLSYGYDAAHNLNWRTNNALIQQFSVNNLNELTTATRSGTLTVAGTTTSAATNVTVNGFEADLYADRAFAKAGFTVTNGWNMFTAVAKDSYGRQDTDSVTLNLPATNTFVYDGNGNLRTNGTRIFDYDDENRLVAMTEPNAWKAEFVYDGAHRRRIQKDFAWTGTWSQTNETRLIYDGNRPIQHRDGNNLPLLTFTRGSDLSGSLEGAGGIGGLLAMTEASPLNPQLSTSLYHCDGNGNVTCLVGTNQLVLARYHYDPFGQTVSISGPKAVVNPYRFSSKPVHELSGTYDYLRRSYEPSLQRWLNRDPIEEAGGVNLYSYVSNGPVDRLDPWGWSDINAPPRSVTGPPLNPKIVVTPISGGWALFSPGSISQPGQMFPMMGPNGQPFWSSRITFTEYPNGYGSQVTVSGTRFPGGACNTVDGSPIGAGSLSFDLSGPPGEYQVNVFASIGLSGIGGGGANATLTFGTNRLQLYGGTGSNQLSLFTNFSVPVTIPSSGYAPSFFNYSPSIGIRQGPEASGTATGTFGFSISQ